MCTICDATQTFDPARHFDDAEGGAALSAAVTETSDAPFSLGTSYSISVGDTFNGAIDYAGDGDVVAITLQAGETYNFTLGDGSLIDPFLAIYDASGTPLLGDDDSGPGLDADLTFTASSSGTYYLGIYTSPAASNPNGTGSYTLTAETAAAPDPLTPGTVEEMADYLTSGFWDETGNSSFRFDTSVSNVITVDLSSLSPEGRQLARWALEAWETVANIRFEESSSGAQIRFQDTDSGAYAGPTSIDASGFTKTALVNVSYDWIATYGTSLDSYSFQTYIHEIGHALGLGHMGNYNGSGSFQTDASFSNDSWQMSVMSYFSQTENSATDASFGFVTAAMMVDIAAIQSLYGAPDAGSATGGNTTWGENSNLGGYWDELFDAIATGTTNSSYSGNNVAFTIYDQGGVDTLDFSFSTTDDRIDLRGVEFSDVFGRTGNIGIADGTVIEKVTSGSGDDVILGNSANNTIKGNGGSDSITGAGGKDTIVGGTGQDTLKGGTGSDTVKGGAAQDRLFGNGGKDKLVAGNGNDILKGGNGHDVLKGGRGNDDLDGGRGNDVLRGGGGADDFIFKGSTIGRDVVKDFKVGTDTLRIDNALWDNNLTKAQVVSEYARVVNGDTVFDFGDGNIIRLEDVSNLNRLSDDIVFI